MTAAFANPSRTRLCFYLTAVFSMMAFSARSPAQAALIQDLSVTGNFSGTGQIVFTTDSGNSVAGVSAFDFTVNSSAGGLPTGVTFGLGDINTIVWSVNPADWSLTIFLQTALISAGGTSVSLTLPNDGLQHGNLCGAFGTNDGATYCEPGVLVGASTLQTTPVHTMNVIPEPSTMLLFSLGLLALGVRRRQSIFPSIR